MFRIVFQRRFGRGSFIGLTVLLVVLAGTASAVRPLNVLAASTDTCGYNPAAAPAPGGGTVVFNENTVTRAIAFYGNGFGGHVGVFTNDESGLFIGHGGTPSSHVPGQAYGEAMPPVFGTGNDASARPFAPTIYLTDITSNASAMGGDWEQGGHAATTDASGLYGSWSPNLGKKPVNKNNWVLGPHADPIPATDAFGGTTTKFNEGYGSEVTWGVSGLMAYDPTTHTYVALQPGHTYRVQSITHDTDENKGNGDVGEVCTTFSVAPGASIQIVKKADAAVVNVGQQIGFKVTVSNPGVADATDVTLSDPLPTNPGLSWTIAGAGGGWAGTCAIDAATETLTCGPVTVPAGTTQATSTFTVHVTSLTTPANGGHCPNSGVIDNTATVNSTNGGSGHDSASTCVNVGTHLPPACTGLQIKPKQLSVGHATTVHLTITDGKNGVAGVRVGIKGAGVNFITGRSNAMGKVTARVKPKRAGIVTFRTVKATSACRVSKRIGVPKGAEKTLTG
jgi:uncharacterized repeat protein (TIGR01451 family)